MTTLIEHTLYTINQYDDDNDGVYYESHMISDGQEKEVGRSSIVIRETYAIIFISIIF